MQHFVVVDTFLRPSVVEGQFRIPYLVSGDSSDLRFPLVADASRCGCSPVRLRVLRELRVCRSSPHADSSRPRRSIGSYNRDRTESVQIFLKTYQELSLNVSFYLPGSLDRGSYFFFSLVNRGHYQALILDVSLTDVNGLAVDVHTSRNRIFRD
jgi:hypothetical protein